MASLKATIELDGTTLEGGGQLLRLALSLSSLMGIPIHVTHIRGKRGAISSVGQGKDGGLKPAHLAAVEWLAKATNAITQGMRVKSTDLEFKPTKAMVDGVWKDIYEQGTLLRRESHIPMSSAGSISLIVQALLPFVLFVDSSVPLRITIEGGTNVSKSPSIDYMTHVLFPTLSSRLGIKPIAVRILKRGWNGGRSDVGSVEFDITPMQKGSAQPAFDLSHRGKVGKVVVCLLAPDDGTREHIRGEVLTQLLMVLPEAELIFTVDEKSGNNQIYLLLIAETSSGFRLGRDCLFVRKVSKAHKKNSEHFAEQENVLLVSKVIKDLEKELSFGGCVDEFMEDQLVVFEALANGKSNVDAGGRDPSLHTQTARWVAEKILDITFDGAGCEGVGFKASESQLPGTSFGANLKQTMEELRV